MPEQKKTDAESFYPDHTEARAPYIRFAGVAEEIQGDTIVRFCRRNNEQMLTLHLREHLPAEKICRHIGCIFVAGPMGCRTGILTSIADTGSYNEMPAAPANTLHSVADAAEVPAADCCQCGRAARHNPEGAEKIAAKMPDRRAEWKAIYAQHRHEDRQKMG
ncbi:S-ribosylhomocysteine lyase [Sporolactobacillus sp. KGMB 08714]|uniref:S-ribosylhomocysteine lyase n=1 Tax=Sporolactobacillus sp. KGMB 08714 TaxID=3064704 RepID=UPI002FBE2C60